MDMAAGTGDGRRLRSADWFGEPGRMGAIYRSWVRGYTPEVFDGRPVIGIADSWSELTPCNAYLRQRAADWHTFRATLPQRVAGVLATAAGAGLLTATAANPGLARLVGPATAAGLAWRLRFRPSADTLAWRHGAQGERRTARLLAPLERAGYQVFHDLAVPGSAANVDHLVVGPTGVYVIDSKRYRGQLRYSGGRLWRGSRSLDRTLETLWWEATQVAETLAFGPDLRIYPVLCVHVARLPWLRELVVDGIPVLDAAALRPALQVTRQALTSEQVALVASQVRAGFRPAA
jgi:hypothetical protein